MRPSFFPRLPAPAAFVVVAWVLSSPVVASTSTSSPEPDEPRVALLIGNANYGSEAVDLDSPPQDLAAMSEAIEGLAFDEVIQVEDADRDAMVRALKQARDATRGGVLFLYYSGHAISVEGTNYLIPVGAHLKRLDDVALEAVSVDQILAMFREPRLRILVLDACRNNPFSLGTKGGGTGLARDDLAGLSGTLISYAATPGATAYDGAPGEVSPYTQALLRHLGTPGLDLPNLFMNVRGELLALTKDGDRGPQRSEEVSTLTHEHRFAFVGSTMLGGSKEGAREKQKTDVKDSAGTGDDDDKPETVATVIPTPPDPGAPLRALVMDFDATSLEDPAVGRTVTDLVSVRLSKVKNLEVIAGEDLRRLVDLEAEKQAIGCDTATEACTAEIAGALGAELVFFGTVSQLDDVVIVTMGSLQTNDVKVRGRETIQVASLGDLPRELLPAVDRLIVASGFEPAPADKDADGTAAFVAEPPYGWGWAAAPFLAFPLGILGGVVGASLVVVFGVLPILRAQELASVSSPTPAQVSEAASLRNDFIGGGFLLPVGGIVVAVVGALIMVASVAAGGGLFAYRALATPSE